MGDEPVMPPKSGRSQASHISKRSNNRPSTPNRKQNKPGAESERSDDMEFDGAKKKSTPKKLINQRQSDSEADFESNQVVRKLMSSQGKVTPGQPLGVSTKSDNAFGQQ